MMAEKKSVNELCGHYFPAVAAALDFFQSEIQERKKTLRNPKQHKSSKRKHITKITYEKVDYIMSYAFGPSFRYMGDIRRCYFSTKESDKIPQRSDSSWNFNAKALEDLCADYEIYNPEEIEKIQWLYISALTVEEVIKSEDGFLSADIKKQVEQIMQSLKSILAVGYGPLYWKVVFKYLSKCNLRPYVKPYMASFPQCKIEFIDRWIKNIEDSTPSLYSGLRCAIEDGLSFLENYRKELLAIPPNEADKSGGNALDESGKWEEIIFYSLTIDELISADVTNKYLIKEISNHKLRPNDLRLIYLVETQFNNDSRRIFAEELSAELKLDYDIDLSADFDFEGNPDYYKKLLPDSSDFRSV